MLGLAAAPAFAANCNVVTPNPVNIGTFSPGVLKAGPTPYVQTSGSFSCGSFTLVSLLGADRLSATVKAATVFTLTRTGALANEPKATFALSASPNGANPLTAGTLVYYMNGLTLINLLSSSSINPAIYIKPSSTAALATGTYTGGFDVQWDWSICTGANVAGICVGGARETGSATASVGITMTVASKTAISITTSTTWDPNSLTTFPKAIPGGKVRMTVSVTNNDTVGVDANSLNIVLPTPTNLTLALDGDGTLGNPVVQSSDGFPPSGMTLSYNAANPMGDNVDFSSDGGTGWSYYPSAGDASLLNQNTAVRFRPQGVMPAGSSFTMSIPYKVRTP